MGSPLSFNQTETTAGGAITKTSNTAFQFNEVGHYRVQTIARTTTLSLLGGIQYFVNGSAVGPTMSLLSAGNVLVLEAVIVVNTVPSTLEVRATSVAVTLASGTTATILFEKLSS